MFNRASVFCITLLLLSSACTPRAATPPAMATSTAPSATLAPTPTSLPTATEVAASPTSSLPLTSPAPTQAPAASATAIFSATPTQPARQSQAIIVDHTSVALFDQIPEEYLAKARALRMMFADASVGKNIDEALNCLAFPNWAAAPPACRNDYTGPDWNWKTFTRGDLEAGRVPARILFTPDPVKYDRQNWVFAPLPGGWMDLTGDFIEDLAPQYLDTTDVLSYQFNYFHVSEISDIADPNKGFFVEKPNQYDFKDLETFIAQHPDNTFIYWTTSLARSIGTQISVDFNQQMRQYALENDLILFDVADIQSHTDQGIPCYDNRDGIEYCSRRADGSIIKCENEPDDGLQIPAICQDYTTEPDAGHLGSVSAGGIRLAKAFWVLMARIAGWQP